MKLRCLSFIAFSVCLCAQTPPSPKPPVPAPQTTQPQLAQPQPAPPAPVPDTAIVAQVNGKDITAGEVKKMLAGAPPQLTQALARDPKAALEQVFLLGKLNELAQQDKLAEKSPWKDMIAFYQKNIYAQAELNYKTNSFAVSQEDQQKYYDDNKSKYEQAKIGVIYISFAADPKTAPDKPGEKKPLAEAEAKAKAEELAKQLRSGADFATLAKQNSDDKNSAEKGGEFGIVKESDRLNEALKKAVFALKPGEISDPVKQPNGFYLIKVEERSVRPFTEVSPEILNQLRQEKFQTWLKSVQDENKVTIQNADFFRTGAAVR
jgi:parvulin-like peptidyl-prolyl isomerase